MHGVRRFLESISKIAHVCVGVREKYQCVNILGIALQEKSGLIFCLWPFSTRQVELAEIQMRRHVLGIKISSTSQFLKSGSPVFQLQLTLRDFVMRIGKSWIDLEGAAVGQQGFTEFFPREIAVAFFYKLQIGRAHV